MDKYVITNIGQLVTLAPLTDTDYPGGVIREAQLGIHEDAWMAVSNGKVINFGTGIPIKFSDWKKVDANHSLILPGLVDAHTHPVFAGNRSSEFCRRLDGVSYQQIASEGGGIKYTIEQTRKAPDEILEDLTRERIINALKLGITTQEIKSGYGLSPSEELRHLRIIQQVKHQVSVTIYTTCLALHDLAPEYQDKTTYINQVLDELIPSVIENKLADAFDAFIEQGYYSVEEIEPYLAAVSANGLDIRLHADEFSCAYGAEAAAKWNARSADHLQYSSEDGLKAMALARVFATILPGTSLYTKIPFTNAKTILDTGCSLVIATDFNPGSCQINNLGLLAGVAALHCHVPPATALAAVTYNAACSLGLGECKGSLAPNRDADYLVFNGMTSWQEWLAGFGRKVPNEIYISGKLVV